MGLYSVTILFCHDLSIVRHEYSAERHDCAVVRLFSTLGIICSAVLRLYCCVVRHHGAVVLEEDYANKKAPIFLISPISDHQSS